jgi:predicted patatin/cPLA2 family phospholipase
LKLFGKNPEKVVQAVANGNRVALVVEGGGMRGAISAGALLALYYLGYSSKLTAIYSVSAGAVNASFLVSGQGDTGIRVYFDHMNNRHFFNPLRLWKIVDIDFIYDEVVPKRMMLNDDSIRASQTALYIGVTNCNTGKQEFFNARDSPVPISRLLKASCALPVLYNRPVPLDGAIYLDGGIEQSLAINRAIDDGFTDIICAYTRPFGYRSSAPSMTDRAVFSGMLGQRFPRLYSSFLGAYRRNNEARSLSEGVVESGVNILLLAPDRPEVVSRLTLNRDVLIGSAKSMATNVAKVFGHDVAPISTQFSKFQRA